MNKLFTNRVLLRLIEEAPEETDHAALAHRAEWVTGRYAAAAAAATLRRQQAKKVERETRQRAAFLAQIAAEPLTDGKGIVASQPYQDPADADHIPDPLQTITGPDMVSPARPVRVRLQPVGEREYGAEAPTRTLTTWVEGVRLRNADGSLRQEAIRRCRLGEELRLRRETSKRIAKAVSVARRNGEQIGYIPEHLSERLFDQMGIAVRSHAEVQDLQAALNGAFLEVSIKVDLY